MGGDWEEEEIHIQSVGGWTAGLGEDDWILPVSLFYLTSNTPFTISLVHFNLWNEDTSLKGTLPSLLLVSRSD